MGLVHILVTSSLAFCTHHPHVSMVEGQEHRIPRSL